MLVRANPARWNWRARLREDVDVAVARDPAVRSRAEVVLGYSGLHAIWAYRLHHAMWVRGRRLSARLISQAVRAATGVEMPCEVPVGRNFVIDHFGGIVISGYAKFGDDCRIRNGVVVGLARTDDPCAPVIGNNVDIGAGAKVLGRIRVGNNVVIGANAVVVRDVADDSIAVGIPAVVKPRGRR